MRARALARQLGGRTSFSIRGSHAARRAAESLGCRLIAEKDSLRDADLVVVDDPNSHKRGRWVRKARKCGCLTVSIHDRLERTDADLAVRGTLASTETRAHMRALDGARFCLLDSTFGDARRMRPIDRGLRPPRVFVALGGGTHVRAVAGQLVTALHQRRPDLQIRVAAGFAGSGLPQLKKARWVRAQSGLLRELCESDVAVVAGGMTLYEACALGVPAVALAVVPAQRLRIRSFAARRAVIDAGTAFGSRQTVNAAAVAVVRLLERPDRRVALASRARRLVDGRGASRVAARIQAMLARKAA
jgi:spore coat polysaccharide biosynthesis predicted glycosyltransferase SpsG